MRILKDNQKRGEVLVKVTTLDDLWYLSQVLDKHDFVTGDTVRKIKLGNGEEGKTQIIKKHARITVEVEKVEFHKYTNALRINGKIKEGPGEVQEKAFPNIKKDATFYADIVKRLQEYDQRYKLDKLIVASPAFWKEEFNKEVVKRAPDLKKKILYTVCHTTGKSAMHEVLKSDEIKKALKDERIIEEIQLVQEVFKEIAKNGNAVYGMREVQEAADIGAIKILLVTDELIQQLRQSESYEPLDNIMKTVEAAGGEIHIITAEHQAGQELQGITGIAAITRYKIKE